MRRLLITLLAAALFAPSASAAGPAFGLRPLGDWKLGYFVYDAHPGTTLTGRIAVTNTGDRGGIVKLFAADATTGQTSGTVYLTSGGEPHGVGAWVSLPATRLELGPNERRVVPFTVHVPAGAEAGQHVGGIVAETIAQTTGPQSKGKTNVQITVRNLSIVAVQVNVPGPQVARFSIGEVTAGGRKGYQQVFVRITNEGNVMAKPGISVTVTDADGTTVLDNRYKLDTILPHTSIDYPVNVTKRALGVGTYHTEVRLTYAQPGGGTAVARATPTLQVTPANVSTVFTSAAAPTPAPATTLGTGQVTTRAAAPAPANGSGGTSPLLIVLLVVGGVVLLAAGWFAATARARRLQRP